jgi:hypothetical protein
MPGFATRLKVADLVLTELQRANPGLAKNISSGDNRKWYMLGALGPAIGDFIPSEAGGLGSMQPRSPYYSIWQLVLKIAVGDAQVNLPGLVQTLHTLQEVVNKLTTLVNNHDFDGMRALQSSGELDKVNQASKDLTTILTYFSDTTNLQPIATLICPTSQPAIDNTARVVPPSQWTGRDWLHWKRPGTFLAALRDSANAWTKAHPGDFRFVAYAVGWHVAYATLVCGSGFINSIVGSCYRTYWWRSRWIQLFVDAWVWGFYGANGTINPENNKPEPSYDKWPSLCNAGLQDWIDLTGGLDPLAVAQTVVLDDPVNSPLPPPLPDDFINFWLDAWTTAYGNPTPALFTARRLQTGFLLTWLVLWFQTSGNVVGCNPNPGSPPDTCGDNKNPPDWVDPTQTNPATGQPFQPQEPTPTHDPNIGEIICGAILAVLGAASLFFGGGIVGAGAIAGGIGLIVNGEKQLNWDELSCQLYWLDVYIFNGLSALHKLCVLAGVQHPYSSDLAQMSETLNFGNVIPIDFPTTGDICKSQGLENMLVPWTCGLLDWRQPPQNAAMETNTALVWAWDDWWPSAFVNDENINPGGSDITVAPAGYNAGVDQPFGPSVQNAVRLITKPASLPNWNLDGDRGIGWLTWQLTAPYTQPVPTQAEP